MSSDAPGAFDDYHNAFGATSSREFYSGTFDFQTVLEEYRPWVKKAYAESLTIWNADGTTDRMEAEKANFSPGSDTALSLWLGTGPIFRPRQARRQLGPGVSASHVELPLG